MTPKRKEKAVLRESEEQREHVCHVYAGPYLEERVFGLQVYPMQRARKRTRSLRHVGERDVRDALFYSMLHV